MKIKIMKETSTFLLQSHHWKRKMLEHIATQTQVLQAMAQTMVKIHQSITEQASLPKAHNTITNDNHQNMTPTM
jgi:sulfur relay (sulfurtransferase) DsrC/TusE family protein